MTERLTERLLLILTVVGFVVPNVLLGIYIADEGFDVSGYFSLWTDNTPSTQLTLDLCLAALAFFVWAASRGRGRGSGTGGSCFPASLLVGLCFGLPLFLLMRERALRGPKGLTTTSSSPARASPAARRRACSRSPARESRWSSGARIPPPTRSPARTRSSRAPSRRSSGSGWRRCSSAPARCAAGRPAGRRTAAGCAFRPTRPPATESRAGASIRSCASSRPRPPASSSFLGQTVVGLLGDRRPGRAASRSRAPTAGAAALRATLTVAADGRDSTIARLARVPARVRPNNRFAYFAYWRGVDSPPDEARLWLLDPDAAAVFPNEDDVTLIATVAHRRRLAEFRADPEAAYGRMVGELPDGPELGGAERVSKLIGKLEMPNKMRPAAGPESRSSATRRSPPTPSSGSAAAGHSRPPSGSWTRLARRSSTTATSTPRSSATAASCGAARSPPHADGRLLDGTPDAAQRADPLSRRRHRPGGRGRGRGVREPPPLRCASWTPASLRACCAPLAERERVALDPGVEAQLERVPAGLAAGRRAGRGAGWRSSRDAVETSSPASRVGDRLAVEQDLDLARLAVGRAEDQEDAARLEARASIAASSHRGRRLGVDLPARRRRRTG